MYNDELPCTNLVCAECPACDKCKQRACNDCIHYSRNAGYECTGCWNERLIEMNEQAKRSTSEIIASMERLVYAPKPTPPELVYVHDDYEAAL